MVCGRSVSQDLSFAILQPHFMQTSCTQWVPWIQLHTCQTGNKFDFPIPLGGDDDYDLAY